MAIAIGEDGAKTNALNRILGKSEFSDVKDQLEELGDAGELTGEKVKKLVMAAPGLYDKLVDLAVTFLRQKMAIVMLLLMKMENLQIVLLLLMAEWAVVYT